MSEKDKSHELLTMWMDLTRAVSSVRRSHRSIAKTEIVPWACADQKVKLAWKRITAPQNLSALEKWHEAESKEKTRLWTEKAIEECKRRTKQSDRSN